MKNLIFFFCLALFAQTSFSQESISLPDDSTSVVITLKNGAVYSGMIIDRNPREILLSSENDAITILRGDIQSVEKTEGNQLVRVIMNDGTEHRGLLIKSTIDQLIIQNKNGKLTLHQDKIQRVEEAFEKERIKIVMLDGTKYEGYQRLDGEEPTTIYTENGKIEYNPEQVKNIVKLHPVSKFAFENPIPTKYFLGPSAIPLQKGTGYYHNQAVVFNSAQAAVSDNVSLGGGMEFLSLFMNGAPLLYGNIKITASASERFHYGGGIITGGILSQREFEGGFFMAPYAMITIGDYDHNITFGGSGVMASYPFGVFTLSGMTRISQKVSLISNNYFAIGDFGTLPGFGIQGVRIMGQSMAFDIGLVVNRQLLSDGFVLPYAGFLHRF
jgi:hypothetical protein